MRYLVNVVKIMRAENSRQLPKWAAPILRHELSRLREEVTLAKRDKATMQARVADLKAALQSTLDANKV